MKWIDVKDKLPKEGWFLCYWERRSMRTLYIDEAGWWYPHEGAPMRKDRYPSHWMELPDDPVD